MFPILPARLYIRFGCATCLYSIDIEAEPEVWECDHHYHVDWKPTPADLGFTMDWVRHHMGPFEVVDAAAEGGPWTPS